MRGCVGHYHEFAALLVVPQAHAFLCKTMINNINNFGVINFYENDNSNHRSENKQAVDVTPEKPATMPPDFFCVSARFSEENIRARLAAELKQATTKIDYCRALYRLQHIGCININQYASDAQRAIVFNNYQDTYKLSASDFCKARMVK